MRQADSEIRSQIRRTRSASAPHLAPPSPA